MKVLVIYASKYGSTKEIADKVVSVLDRNGFETTYKKVGDEVDLLEYDAVIIGSAVYAGNWMSEAKSFVLKNIKDLKRKPVWLFSSGPVGDPDKSYPKGTGTLNIEDILSAVNVIDHKIFLGKLDKNKINMAERAIVFAFKAPVGDFRQWDEIERWSDSIVKTLNRE